MYNSIYSPQTNLDRINAQINELERAKAQFQQPMQQPITQNFQLAPTNHDVIRYANSIDEVQRNIVLGETPYFSKDMSVLWIKNLKGEIRTYELTEIIPKDDKDIQIEMLQAQINEMKGMIENAKSNDDYVDEPIKNEKSTNVSIYKPSTKKSK